MKVVLLHAFPLGPEMWAPQREVLEAHDVIAPNLYELEGNSIDGWAEQVWDGFVKLGLDYSDHPLAYARPYLMYATVQDGDPQGRNGRIAGASSA